MKPEEGINVEFTEKITLEKKKLNRLNKSAHQTFR
jgi:hypothetical protein